MSDNGKAYAMHKAFEKIKELEKENAELKASNSEARVCISEAVDLFEDIQNGEYTVDSLTDQPYRAWLNETPSQSLASVKAEAIRDANTYLMRSGLKYFPKTTIRKVSEFLADFLQLQANNSDIENGG